MANVVPLGDKILVKRLEAEDRTAGGILLPDSAKEKPREGKVVALGKGKLLDNGERVGFQVEVADRILFTSYGGSEIKINGEEFLVLSEEDVLAIIKTS